MGVFDRISITIGGWGLTARPVEFEYDKDKNPVSCIKYETTCPSCGNGVLFFGLDNDNVICPTCVGKVIPKDKVVINNRVQIISEEDLKKPVILEDNPFQDPIGLGLFKLDYCYE